MVKQGRAKKARSGRSKTKLKTSANAFYKKPIFSDKNVEKQWDPKLSVDVNMRKIGLVGSANADIVGGGKRETNVGRGDAVALFDIPQSGVIEGRTKKDIMLPMSVNDQTYIYKLTEKHGIDFKAMSFDIKTLNKQQLTRKKLENMARKFLKLDDKERVIEHDVEMVETLLADLREIDGE